MFTVNILSCITYTSISVSQEDNLTIIILLHICWIFTLKCHHYFLKHLSNLPFQLSVWKWLLRSVKWWTILKYCCNVNKSHFDLKCFKCGTVLFCIHASLPSLYLCTVYKDSKESLNTWTKVLFYAYFEIRYCLCLPLSLLYKVWMRVHFYRSECDKFTYVSAPLKLTWRSINTAHLLTQVYIGCLSNILDGYACLQWCCRGDAADLFSHKTNFINISGKFVFSLSDSCAHI